MGMFIQKKNIGVLTDPLIRRIMQLQMNSTLD